MLVCETILTEHANIRLAAYLQFLNQTVDYIVMIS